MLKVHKRTETLESAVNNLRDLIENLHGTPLTAHDETAPKFLGGHHLKILCTYYRGKGITGKIKISDQGLSALSGKDGEFRLSKADEERLRKILNIYGDFLVMADKKYAGAPSFQIDIQDIGFQAKCPHTHPCSHRLALTVLFGNEVAKFPRHADTKTDDHSVIVFSGGEPHRSPNFKGRRTLLAAEIKHPLWRFLPTTFTFQG